MESAEHASSIPHNQPPTPFIPKWHTATKAKTITANDCPQTYTTKAAGNKKSLQYCEQLRNCRVLVLFSTGCCSRSTRIPRSINQRTRLNLCRIRYYRCERIKSCRFVAFIVVVRVFIYLAAEVAICRKSAGLESKVNKKQNKNILHKMIANHHNNWSLVARRRSVGVKYI